MGVVRCDVAMTDPRFGKIYQCPDCRKQEENALSGLNASERLTTLDFLETDSRPGAYRMKLAATQFIKYPFGFLSIFGGNGNGKTTTLHAIVNALISQSVDARYMLAHELTEMAKAAIKSDRDSPYEYIQRLARVQVLVIDEMDKAQWSEYNITLQNYFFNARYRDENRLGTVLAWNGSFGTLPMPSILSRLSQFPICENTDPDMRSDLAGL